MSGVRQTKEQLNYGMDPGYNPWETTSNAMSKDILGSPSAKLQSHGTQTTTPRTVPPTAVPPYGTQSTALQAAPPADPPVPGGSVSPGSQSSVKLAPKHVHQSPEAKALRTTGSTASWNPISHDLKPHTPADYAVRAPNTALRIGTSVLPGQSQRLGYGGEVSTTMGEFGKNRSGGIHTPEAYAVKAPNAALAMGTQVLPGQSQQPGYGGEVSTTMGEIGKNERGESHTPADYAQKVPNAALAVGSQAIPYEGYFQAD